MKRSPFNLTTIIRFVSLVLSVGAVFIGCATKADTNKWTKQQEQQIKEALKTFVPKQIYAVSYDKLWDATMTALDKNQIPALSADKTSGIIQTDYFGEGGQYSFLRGAANRRYKCIFNLTSRNQPYGNVKLNIIIKCEMSESGGGIFNNSHIHNEQWHDVSSLNVEHLKEMEKLFYYSIEKELSIGDGGNAQQEPPQPSVGNFEVLTNDSIVQLVKAGMSEEIIVSMIKTQPTRFDVGVDGILALKTNGVGDKIINEMVLRGQTASVAAAPSPTGVSQLNNSAETVAPMMPATASTNMITDPAVEKLCEMLDQDNVGKVKDALNKLRDKKLRDNASQAVPKILPCLTDSKPDVVREALKTLAAIGNQDAVPAILPLLTNDRPDIVREACRTLAIIGNKDVIPSLQPLLTNSRSDIRAEAYKAITKLQAEP